jgi:RNA pol II accessory factor, Cdc73 family, C-terminal
MITDPDEAKEQLLKWSSDYAKVQITEAALTGDGISIDATTRLNNGYSVASVFLQVRDPEIALVRYRNLCKDFKVADPIKASDKAQIVAEFTVVAPTDAVEFKEPQQQQQQQPPTAAKPAAPQAPAPASREKHRSSSKSKSSSSGHKRPPPPPPPPGASSGSRSSKDKSAHHHHARKKPELVTTEQLFANLNGVVDKRSVGLSKIAAAITNALSTAGFEVTDTTIFDEATKKRTEAIMAKEIPVGNSASILRSNDPRKDLKRVLELYKEAVMVNPKDKDTNGKSSSAVSTSNNNNNSGSSTSNASPSKRNLRAHLVGQKPVIVVPKGMTAPITLLNAYAFFHDATFTPRDQIKTRTNVPTKFTRNVLGNIPLEFDITDNPGRFFDGGTKDWDRIVAVIVLGKDWQFKDWIPGFNAPATLFQRVFGYYIGDRPPAQWAVQTGMLHRDRQALDSIAYSSFWTQLEEWMRVHKPELILKTTTD